MTANSALTAELGFEYWSVCVCVCVYVFGSLYYFPVLLCSQMHASDRVNSSSPAQHPGKPFSVEIRKLVNGEGRGMRS